MLKRADQICVGDVIRHNSDEDEIVEAVKVKDSSYLLISTRVAGTQIRASIYCQDHTKINVVDMG